MKMKNEELLKLRIQFYFLMTNLDVSVKVRFQDVLTLIDSPAFLQWVKKVRNDLHISKVPFTSPRKLLLTANAIKPSSNLNATPKHVMQVLRYSQQWQLIYKAWYKNKPSKKEAIEAEAKRMFYDLNRHYYLWNVALQAVILGMVGDVNKTTEFVSGKLHFPFPNIIIVPNPRTTYKEVKAGLREAKRYYKLPHKLSSGKKYKPKLPKYVPNFEKYYVWYWQRLESKTYADIANDWVDKHPEDDNVGEIEVLKGVKKYTSLLST